MNSELLSQLISALALTLVSLLAFASRSLVQVGIEYLRSKIGQTAFERLRSYADVTVKMLEQHPAFKEFDGGKKKEMAILAVLQFAEKNKLPIDRDQIDKFIEASVQEMKSQIGQIDWKMIEAEVGEMKPFPGTDN